MHYVSINPNLTCILISIKTIRNINLNSLFSFKFLFSYQMHLLIDQELLLKLIYTSVMEGSCKTMEHGTLL